VDKLPEIYKKSYQMMANMWWNFVSPNAIFRLEIGP